MEDEAFGDSFYLHGTNGKQIHRLPARRVPLLHRSFPDVRLLQIRQLDNDHGILELLPVFDLCE